MMNKIDKQTIFTLFLLLLIPLCGWWLWTELTGEENGDLEEKLKQRQIADEASRTQGAAPQTQAPPQSQAPTQTPPAQNESAAMETPPAENTLAQNSEIDSSEKKDEKVPDEKADWKTYKDNSGKFEFKYPDDATVADGGNFVTVSQNGKTWRIRTYDNKKKEDLQTWFNGYFTDKERKNCSLADSSIKIGAYETKYANPNSGETVCEEDGYYAINSKKTEAIKIKIGEETTENVNKILETFRFAE